MKKLAIALLICGLVIGSATQTLAGDIQRIPSVTVSATPTITANSAYSNVQQLGGVQTLDVALDSRSGVDLRDLTVIDLDKQSSAIDVFFFRSLPTFTSADKGTWALTGANAQLLVGVVSLAAANYSAANAQSFISKSAIGLVMHPKPVTNSTGVNTTKLYAVAVSRGTPTYTTTTSLVFLYKFVQQ